MLGMERARSQLGTVLIPRALGALLVAGMLSSGSSLPVIGSGAETCPAAAGKMPLVNENAQISENGGNTVKCDYERYGKKGRFRSGVYLQLAWIEDGSPAEPWVDLDVWCGASELDPDCTNSCFTYPRQGQRLLYVSWVASSADEWDPRPVVGRTAEELAAAFEHRAAVCPAGFATPAASAAASIVLSGVPGEEPPPIGSAIEVPEDDQHRIVIGGPDGSVIREEFIGDQAEVIGYGPIARDADGSWSILTTVKVSTIPAPSPTPSPDATATPASTPARTSVPDTPGSDPSDTSAVPSSTEVPAVESPSTASPPASGPLTSPTPVPPPELIGVPDGITAIVAELPPAGAGAVRNVSDHLAVLGEMLETEQSGTVEIPPSDIGSLRELVPGLVREVWLTDGSIVVSTADDRISSILVTPVIGRDGLISVELSQYQFATYHPVVGALVAALNGYVAERGGRFTDVSVTPEGLTVSAERAPQE